MLLNFVTIETVTSSNRHVIDLESIFNRTRKQKSMKQIMIENDITKKGENNDLRSGEPSRNIDGEADGSESSSESFSNLNHLNLKLSKINAMRDTIDALEKSLKSSKALEIEQSSRYSIVKMKNWNLSDELRDADKRNKNMLNLFRSNVTDFGFENIDDLPFNLKLQVQRSWHQKYDAMLELTEQLKNKNSMKDETLRDKENQIEALEKRLLNLADHLVQREETLANICVKYLSLKKRKDEQEFLLRGSIETLQDALQKASCDVDPTKSFMTLIPSKEALLAREIRRSDRLARENFILRGLLQEARRGCTCSIESLDSCSSISLGRKI